MRRAAEAPAAEPQPVRADRSGRASKSAARMTTAVCKRASRMARPSEPSEVALVAAERLVNDAEDAMRFAGLVKRSTDDTYVFKHTAPSTGKGPAVRAGAGEGESDAAAQAMMNHVRKAPFFALLFHPTLSLTCAIVSFSRCVSHKMVSIKSRRVDTNNQEPSWLIDVHNTCPHMYGRLAANAIKSNAVNSSVTKRAKTQGAANQVCYTASSARP